MKIVLITGLFALLILTGCQEEKSEPKRAVAKEITNLADSSFNKDSLLFSLSNQILVSIKNKDFHSFTKFMHPDSGTRFSPYAYITTSDKQLNRQDFLKAVNSGKLIDWGITAGNGDIMLLTVKDYFAKFYRNTEFTESYFSGFDKKYGGMDWRTLRLVYKKQQDEFYLVGIVHDEWTP